MTHCLSRIFEEARSGSSNWSPRAVREVLDYIAASKADLLVDWELGDEEWGRVLEGGSVVALVCAKMPLVFLHKPFDALLSSLDERKGLWVVAVESFDSECYSVSRQLLEGLFGRRITENVSCDSLSISDLWWATV